MSHRFDLPQRESLLKTQRAIEMGCELQKRPNLKRNLMQERFSLQCSHLDCIGGRTAWFCRYRGVSLSDVAHDVSRFRKIDLGVNLGYVG